MSKLNLLGHRFGRLKVIAEAPSVHTKAGRVRAFWQCLCNCGNKKLVSTAHLRNGNVRSCGCLSRELSVVRATKHGHATGGKTSKEYAAWHSLKTRCLNPDDKSYQNYGGRGIKVCERWLESFDNFYADMGPAPSAKHSIDRKDNDGHYEPINCRWATPSEQTQNRRVCVRITYEGVTYPCIEAFCRENGLNVHRFKYHYRRQKHSLEDSVSFAQDK